jgi:uncharacterized membrane protein YphA (DoxX/SURF4 family)
MQRLFSMFPMGSPGIALLLLRVPLSANLVRRVIEVHANIDTAWVQALLATVAIALCIGLFTPVSAVLCALIEMVIWHFSSGAVAVLHICAIPVAIALAMLGPGAYSLDARLFGRRQVIFPPSDGPKEE